MVTHMETSEFLSVIRRDGDLMSAAADRGGPEATIPTCPEWCMRDLIQHQGRVHRWATAIVQDRLAGPDVDTGPMPSDGDLVPWFRDGCAALIDVLANADPELECFTFLPAPSPVEFWARRQTHETAIHRADAESATGAITPFAPDVADDGIDELVLHFASRPRSRLRSDPPRALALAATDTGSTWNVLIEGDRVQATRDATHGSADCEVRAPASDLFLFLWNRRPRSDIDVSGDEALVDLWHEKVRI
jgi:uncharacterized protein (TIGR03083 family)